MIQIRKKSRPRHKRLFFLVLLVAIIVFFSFRFLFVNSEAYKLVINISQKSMVIQKYIGGNITPSFWAGGKVGYSAANFQIPIYGEHGRGTLEAVVEKEGGKWVIVRLIVVLDSGKIFNLLKE